MTFDDEFTKDRSIDKRKWNGGAGGTDWCSLDFHGKPGGAYMFGDVSDPCGQHYDGCTLSRTNGLEMRSTGSPSAALQTGGTTAQTARFIQKFGYWEARLKVPHNTHGEGTGLHSDFWIGNQISGTSQPSGSYLFSMCDGAPKSLPLWRNLMICGAMGGTPYTFVDYERVFAIDPKASVRVVVK